MKLFNKRIAYTLLLWLLLPYVFLHLLWRARRQPEYLQHLGERFGRYAVAADQPVLWLHTVSVGETRAVATLVARLRASYPGHRILLTHTTPTGRTAGEQLFGDDVLRVYLPYDYPFAVQRFLEHFKPRLGVLMETEIWFNLIGACRAAKIPLLLLNARLSEQSARNYARARTLTREALHALTLVAAQTEDDALRLASLGNRAVPVMGNLKFDIEPPADQLALGAELRRRFGSDRPILLAASTREGEEALLLNALQHAAVDNLLTVIVPRHPQRFKSVLTLITLHGFRLQQRSSNEPVAADTQVVLGDSMGELFAYYAACDIAFIGGSLLPLGGQNLIEACAVGKPVLLGPHTFNFTQAADTAIAHGAALRVQHADDMVHLLNVLMYEPARMQAMGEAGRRFVEENQGATERAVCLIDTVLARTV